MRQILRKYGVDHSLYSPTVLESVCISILLHESNCRTFEANPRGESIFPEHLKSIKFRTISILNRRNIEDQDMPVIYSNYLVRLFTRIINSDEVAQMRLCPRQILIIK